MVRFKNRHLLVEFLQPSLLSPSFQSTSALQPPAEEANDVGDDEEGDDDDEMLYQIPEIPFMLPLSSLDGTKGSLKLGDEGGSAIYRAIRGIVQDVYGDEGWGRISSSFKVIYHSPLTTLTIMRISRSHYRLLWSAITLISSLNGQAVLPRVVAVSGTIKKLQNAAIVYHRNITAQVLAVALDGKGESWLDVKAKSTDGSSETLVELMIGSALERDEQTKRLEGPWEKERATISSLED